MKKLFSFSLGTISAAIIGIISIPLITRLVDPSEYGKVTIFLTLASLLSIIGMGGLDQTFVRFFYEVNRIKLFWKTIGSSLIIISTLALLLFIFQRNISEYISPEKSYALLITLYILSYILYRFSSLILRMLQYGYRYSFTQALFKILELAFILVIIFLSGPNHFSIIIGTIITMSLMTLISLYLSKDFWKETMEFNENIDGNIDLKKIIKYSFPIMLSSIMAVLFQTFDKYFLNAWSTSEVLGIYSAGFKLIAVLNILQGAFSVFWTPYILEHYKKNPSDRSLYSNVSIMVTVIMLFAAIVIIGMKDIIVLILGAEYHSASNVMAALVLMPIMYTMSETTVQGINFKLKTHLHLITTGIALMINVLMSILLIPTYGMEGAAISVGLAYVSFYLLRTYFGLKYFYFDIKINQTLTMITLIVIWILLIMKFDNFSILITGTIVLPILLFMLFKNEILRNLKVVQKFISERGSVK